MLCVLWGAQGCQASTLISPLPGIWSHIFFEDLEMYASQNRAQLEFLTFFSFVLFLWWLAAKLHIAGSQNISSPWLTVVEIQMA